VGWSALQVYGPQEDGLHAEPSLVGVPEIPEVMLV
jgi:hypothetical protein